MDIGDLPEAMQENIIALKYGSATIEADILHALDEAEDLKEFQENVITAIDDLKEEIEAVLILF